MGLLRLDAGKIPHSTVLGRSAASKVMGRMITRIKPKTAKVVVCMALLGLVGLACGTNETATLVVATPTLPQPAGSLIAREAISNLEFEVPEGWQMIGHDRLSYSTGVSLLNVFVFDAESADPVSGINSLLEAISEDTVIERITYDTTATVASFNTVTVSIEGRMIDSDNHTHGLYVAFERAPWVYLFAWDTFDEDVDLMEVASLTLASIRFADD